MTSNKPLDSRAKAIHQLIPGIGQQKLNSTMLKGGEIMTLDTLRGQWERGLKVIRTHYANDMLYVLLNAGDIPIGDNWNVSVDHMVS